MQSRRENTIERVPSIVGIEGGSCPDSERAPAPPSTKRSSTMVIAAHGHVGYGSWDTLPFGHSPAPVILAVSMAWMMSMSEYRLSWDGLEL